MINNSPARLHYLALKERRDTFPRWIINDIQTEPVPGLDPQEMILPARQQLFPLGRW